MQTHADPLLTLLGRHTTFSSSSSCLIWKPGKRKRLRWQRTWVHPQALILRLSLGLEEFPPFSRIRQSCDNDHFCLQPLHLFLSPESEVLALVEEEPPSSPFASVEEEPSSPLSCHSFLDSPPGSPIELPFLPGNDPRRWLEERLVLPGFDPDEFDDGACPTDDPEPFSLLLDTLKPMKEKCKSRRPRKLCVLPKRAARERSGFRPELSFSLGVLANPILSCVVSAT